MLKKNGNLLHSTKSGTLFSLFISIIHALAEVIVVTIFYYSMGMAEEVYSSGYVVSVLLLVGVGTFIHSMVDFSLALLVWKPLQHVITIPVNARIRANNYR